MSRPLRLREGDARQVCPLALYLDGIKFMRAIDPRADTVVAITMYNVMTMKRHLIAVISKREVCRCGCRGWCSYYVIFRYVAWSLAAAGDELDAARGDSTGVEMS